MAVIIKDWRCWSCKHVEALNLPHDLLPSPRCPKCKNAMLAVAKHQCSGCNFVYGEGNNKPIRGFCNQCWENHLAEQRANAKRLYRIVRWSEMARDEKGNLLVVSRFEPVHWCHIDDKKE